MKSLSTLILAFVIVSLSIKTFGSKLLSLTDNRYRGDDLGFE
jgi:hypothetical protein